VIRGGLSTGEEEVGGIIGEWDEGEMVDDDET
jgi:hypothetical protein